MAHGTHHYRGLRLSLWATLLLCLGACGSSDGDDGLGFRQSSQFPFQTLSEYDFFAGDIAELAPRDGVVPYQVTSPLWADHAGKARFIVVPQGEFIEPMGDEDWMYPSGTIIIKNFFYSRDRSRPEDSIEPIETRLMIKENDDWVGHTYVWNASLTDAVRKVAGARVELDFLDEDGTPKSQQYVVPNTNQCKDCHERHEESRPLGLVARQLDRMVIRNQQNVSQIDYLNAAGIFKTPLQRGFDGHLVDPFGAASVAERARSYLDSNCAHCHRDGGNGGPSGLVLLASETNPTAFGICKGPVAAGKATGGFYHDILPGEPDKSIMVHRMKSADPEVKMPEIPNRLPHDAGVALISEWIRGMSPQSCD